MCRLRVALDKVVQVFFETVRPPIRDGLDDLIDEIVDV